ncbi:Thioredoxin domain-containing protein [Acidaminobacter hydrogenoformans DSM 2784]|uniref:Thioredoxin domain-containing protein n=2 Tax=Acidaminobacter TaxID=65402 RepID=A0A1G5S0T8_9FIRM|nr:Thioredoxin domain-containing protein [Acidaminobacter hydrogenoformans DSM 2784]
MKVSLEVEIIGDIRLIREAGVEMMPAMAMEGKILHQGRTPNVQEAIAILEKALAEAASGT